MPPLYPSGIRYQVLSLGALVADTGANPVNTATVTSLPNQWGFSNIASNGVFRMNWSDLALFTINGNQLTVQWIGPNGGLLESAPTVFGPWTLVPNQTEFSTTMPMTVPAQFFRVRSN